ncbi:ABC transporter transmembrane domain-containing protein [Streptomyces clavuligerus]|uniref:ABC transporter transmembrane domain-containing protein n=1 Tax=Streptomyces clavuligerus TaxID=1901 RepID=UPI00020D90F8|nr:ABC transporter ATP-binding protein [Streptomyces clavuligerus]WDN57569.1 ABC transporter ATP-binding protein/permease [Streptomyces clavuligerus]
MPGVPAGELFRIALLRGGRGLRLGLTTVGFMLHQLCEALVPILIGVVIDQALEPGDPGALLRWLAVLAGVFLVLSLSYQRAAAAMVGVYGHAEQELRRLAVTRLLDPFGLRRAPGPGEALSLVTSDSYRVAGVSWSVVEQAATLTAILTASTALLLISVPLAVGVMVSTVLVLLLMRRLAAPLEARGLAEQGSAARAGEVATDMITGLRVLAGMHAQPEAAARYRAASDASRRGAVAAARAVLSYSALSQVLSGVFLAALVTASGWLALDGRLTIGQLVTVLGLAQFLQGALAHVGTFASDWAHKRASARRIAGLLSEPALIAPPVSGAGQKANKSEKTEKTDKTDGVDASGSRTRHKVSAPGPRTDGSASSGDARVPGAVGGAPAPRPGAAVRMPAARTASADPGPGTVWYPPGHGGPVELVPGALIGVVPRDPGHARWLSDRLGCRVRPVRGELLIDGADAVDLGPEAVRARIAAPPHQGTLFSGTLRANLTPPGGTLDPAVVRAAMLDEVLEHIGGQDTEIGEHGRRLSGGQRQRLMLARALHAETPVVVLDEPATAVDPVTERRIAEGLAELPGTVLLITTSRILLSTCDRVVDLTDTATGDAAAPPGGDGTADDQNGTPR